MGGHFLALGCLAAGQFGLHHRGYLLVADIAAVGVAPGALGQGLIARRHLAGETLDGYVGAQALDKIADQGYILVEGDWRHLNAALLYLTGEGGATEDLQLMEFDAVEGQGVEDVGLGDNLFPTLAGEPYDEMSAAVEAALGGEAQSALGGGEVVATVDGLEGAVVATLDAVFYGHETALGEVVEIVEEGLADAVGAGADDDALDQGMRQGLGVALAQHVEGRIGVAVGLEIGKIAAGVAIAPLVEGYALVNLLGDGLDGTKGRLAVGVAIGGIEGHIVAEGAARRGERPVAVGAGEAGIDREFLDATAKDASHIGSIRIISRLVVH